jgi:hypothetical protein
MITLKSYLISWYFQFYKYVWLVKSQVFKIIYYKRNLSKVQNIDKMPKPKVQKWGKFWQKKSF